MHATESDGLDESSNLAMPGWLRWGASGRVGPYAAGAAQGCGHPDEPAGPHRGRAGHRAWRSVVRLCVRLGGGVTTRESNASIPSACDLRPVSLLDCRTASNVVPTVRSRRMYSWTRRGRRVVGREILSTIDVRFAHGAPPSRCGSDALRPTRDRWGANDPGPKQARIVLSIQPTESETQGRRRSSFPRRGRALYCESN